MNEGTLTQFEGGGEGVAREGSSRADRVHRGMFLLPSLFTATSIGAGYFAITQTIDAVSGIGNANDHLDLAAIAICLAIPFDALDGRIARMTNTTSEFGKELDSLADAITFGAAPCLLAWVWGFHFLPDPLHYNIRQPLLQIGSFVCFLYLLCGASRLARFNISHEPEVRESAARSSQPAKPGRRDRKYFVGMPIPAAAGVIGATVHLCYGFPIMEWWVAILWIVLVGLLGFLMVSTWRFWSGKEINFSRRQPFQLLAPLAIVIFLVLWVSRGALFFLALAYLFSGLWARAAYSWSRRRRLPVEPMPAGTPSFLNDAAAPWEEPFAVEPHPGEGTGGLDAHRGFKGEESEFLHSDLKAEHGQSPTAAEKERAYQRARQEMDSEASREMTSKADRGARPIGD